MQTLRAWSVLAFLTQAASALTLGAATPGAGYALVQRSASIATRTSASRQHLSTVPWYASGTFVGDLEGSTVTQNNLGGMGPMEGGDPVIVYTNIGTVNGISVNLRISNLTEYHTADGGNFHNAKGLSGESKFGIINVKCGTHTELRFSFVDSEGNPVTMHNLWITFLDLDADNTGTGHEVMGVLTNFSQFLVDNDTELEQTSLPDEGTVWQSTEIGNGMDNPKDPAQLTDAMRRKAASVQFVNKSFVDTVFGMTNRSDGSCGPGRNLMFNFQHIETTPVIYTCGTCVIWGDPHIITFKTHQHRLAEHPQREEFFRTRAWKTDQFTVNAAGLYWLVKSDRVQIQGGYVKNETSNSTTLTSLAVGGAFLQDRVLIIRPLAGRTTWDGEEILTSLPSEFQNEYVHAKYHAGTKMVKDGTRGPGIDISLPQGVTLRVNRWRSSLAAEISMCPTEGQGGQCGSFVDGDSM